MTHMPEVFSNSDLIIGGDGMIGMALRDCLAKAGRIVFSTTRRKPITSDRQIPLDLEIDGEDAIGNISPTVAYFCAGITSIQLCEDRPVETWSVNVEAVAKLVKVLLERGTFVVYLSSNAVFSGARPAETSDAACQPGTEYGRQKAAAEQRLISLSDRVAIIRMTKVIGPKSQLFMQWRDALGAKLVIHPYRDLYMAPTSTSFAVGAIAAVGIRRIGGIYHVSGARDLNYAEFGKMLAQRMGASTHLVDAVNSPDTGVTTARREPYSSLDMTALTNALGIKPQSVESVIDEFLACPLLT